jgi:hypothetical protein
MILCPSLKKCIPPGGKFRVHRFEFLILALQHRGADITPYPPYPLVVEGIVINVLPSEIKEHFDAPDQLEGFIAYVLGISKEEKFGNTDLALVIFGFGEEDIEDQNKDWRIFYSKRS